MEKNWWETQFYVRHLNLTSKGIKILATPKINPSLRAVDHQSLNHRLFKHKLFKIIVYLSRGESGLPHSDGKDCFLELGGYVQEPFPRNAKRVEILDPVFCPLVCLSLCPSVL